ncbi:MAG: hypothetical protein IKJ16_00850 [Agathobacter sp.]|nr:hypothetical protein [Agathobacter sp.]
MAQDQRKKLIKVTLITFAVFAVMMISSYIYMYNNGLSGQYANTKPKEGQIKVACIGDGITYGHGISDWKKNNYPALLQELLGEEYHVANFGSSGACVNPDGDQPYVNREVYQDALDYDADIIVFMMGTNDAKLENLTDEESFLEDYNALLGSLMEGKKEPKVYVGLCPEAFYTEDADESTGVASYNIQPAVVDEIVDAISLHATTSDFPIGVIDIHSLTEAHPEWFEADGIHPNNDGAKAIAESIANMILK